MQRSWSVGWKGFRLRILESIHVDVVSLGKDFFHAQLGLDVFPYLFSPIRGLFTYPWTLPIQGANQAHICIIFYTFSPSLPAPAYTSHPCHQNRRLLAQVWMLCYLLTYLFQHEHNSTKSIIDNFSKQNIHQTTEKIYHNQP